MTSQQPKRVFFLASYGSDAGLTSMTLGLVHALERDGIKVGFVKPIAQPASVGAELSSHFARQLCNIDAPASIPFARAQAMLREGELATLMEDVVRLAEQARDNHDVLIVEGLVPDSDAQTAIRLNAEMAGSLSAELLLVLSGAGRGARDIAECVQLVQRQFGADGNGKLAGLLLNRGAECGNLAGLRAELAAQGCATPLLGCVPYDAKLDAPRVLDVVSALGLKIEHAGQIEQARMRETVVAARTVEKMAERLLPGTLVVTPGDRSDVVLATSLAMLRGVPLAGLLLTCGEPVSGSILPLIQSARQAGLTILSTERDTYETSTMLANLDRHVAMEDAERMQAMIDFVAERIDTAVLVQKIGEPREVRLPPPAFRHRLIESARRSQKRIVLPEGDEPRTIQAAAICHEKGIARCVLIGEPERIRQVAEAQGVTLPADIEILAPKEAAGRYVAPMMEMRKSKGLTAPQAAEQLEDSVVIGTMMLALNEVDGLVSGAVHTTANTIRPALQLIKTAPGASIVSSIFFMLMPDQVLVYGDCAVNPDPNAEQLADIAIQSADSARAFGLSPRVAMISYSTGTSGSGSDVEKVREATRIAKEKRPDLMIDGPMQYDAASVESVGRQKAPDSEVAGRANVFVFPDLNTGNTTYKAVQRSAGVVSVGPMLQGLRKPVNDLSRGALVDDIVYTIALTAIQADAQ
ncbi:MULTISPECIES: phosphate acetyltransferase [Chromobacterium]|uniref:Phosphate acetyltransferase n=2 Tax=Chromobacterium TaxID=535 RepID=A0ABS3GSY3_9NEIS|nr:MULTISPECIES: phosphate acetyltransferase [Chromobacterium]AXT47146.1 phosphate acetyltransferase [Chromobacterium rhizoryzae]MBK0417041.1 phosphate acetyltransferase [Chromobacterium haemolyticum]MBO0418167.1 phosphate acetyltransferase [Chromobacterium haemolyticum]MBO0501440.1 phosphate acetyltransferase [Chromobacterium haemolyticum]QOD80971.1 phosphate acetyltransferase [Chromobacterium haemolyticum]